MKTVALLLVLGSFSVQASDKINTITEKVKNQGTYLLCEQKLFTNSAIKSLKTTLDLSLESLSSQFIETNLSAITIFDEGEMACIAINKK